MKQKKQFLDSIKNFFIAKKEQLNQKQYNQKKYWQEDFEWQLKKEKSVLIDQKTEENWWSNKKIVRFWLIWLLIFVIWYFSFKVLNIIFLIISAYIVSIILESFISWFQKRRLSRWLSIFFSYFIFIVILLGVFVIVIPFLYRQLSEVWSVWLWYLSQVQTTVSEKWLYSTIMDMENLPDTAKEYFVSITSDQWTMLKIQETVQNNIDGIINRWKKSASQFWLFLVNFISWFTGFLVNFLLFLVLSILFSVEKDLITNFLAKLGWNSNVEITRLKIQKIYYKLAVWLKSRLLLSLLLAVAMWVCLVVMWRFGVHVPWKIWLCLLVWLLDLIPYIWPIITWILLFIIWFLYNSFWVAIVVVLILWIINVVENNIWAPLFMNKALWVSAVLIFISMLVWWLIMWFFGVLLSVPIAVIITIMFENKDKLESDEISQIEKQENREENLEFKQIKKELRNIEYWNKKGM